MEAPPRYSVSPLPSFCTVITSTVPRYVSFQETVQAIWRHLTGKPRPSMRERWLAEQAIERLAEELDAEMEEETRFISANKTGEHDETKSHAGRTG